MIQNKEYERNSINSHIMDDYIYIQNMPLVRSLREENEQYRAKNKELKKKNKELNRLVKLVLSNLDLLKEPMALKAENKVKVKVEPKCAPYTPESIDDDVEILAPNTNEIISLILEDQVEEEEEEEELEVEEEVEVEVEEEVELQGDNGAVEEEEEEEELQGDNGAVEEEEEDEVEEVIIKGKRYYTTSTTDGLIYEADEEGEISVEVGKYEKGKVVFYKK